MKGDNEEGLVVDFHTVGHPIKRNRTYQSVVSFPLSGGKVVQFITTLIRVIVYSTNSRMKALFI
jgi:hypothetical protein